MSKKGNVIVFGGSGFLGSHVADALTEEGYSVKVFDIKESPYLQKSQEMIVGDIMDADAVKKAVQGCSYVYNLAGLADLDDAHFKPVDTANLNIIGTINTLEATREAKVKRYIFASTVYVFSEQGSFYRASKQSAERYIEAYEDVYKLPYTILRYGSLYGRRADNRNGIYRLLEQALKEKKISYQGSGEELREYIHVVDASKSSVDILADQYENQHIILTGNEKMRSRDLVKMISEMLGNKIQYDFTDSQLDGHYTITPYSFNPKIGKKMVNTLHIDMGQGLLDCLGELYDELKPGMSTEADWLLKK